MLHVTPLIRTEVRQLVTLDAKAVVCVETVLKS